MLRTQTVILYKTYREFFFFSFNIKIRFYLMENITEIIKHNPDFVLHVGNAINAKSVDECVKFMQEEERFFINLFIAHKNIKEIKIDEE